MADEEHPKAIVEGYNPVPFFYGQAESQTRANRYVAWSGRLSQLKSLVYDVLKVFSPHAQVLLKVDKQDAPDGAVWTRYHGEAPLAKVVQAMRSHERFVFRDGYTQLCVRDDDTGEYIAIDDYGLLWIYSDDVRFADICRQHGFEERPESLISDRGHFRCAIPDADELGDSFVKALHLEEVE